MLSQNIQTKIANICYAHILGLVAMFSNPKYRGPNFKWENFADMCESQSFTWMLTSYTGRRTKEVEEFFAKFAREIAEKTVKDMTST